MKLRALRALLVVAGVLFGLYGYHLLRSDLHSSAPNALLSITVAWTFLFAGIVAWARRPHSRMGILMTFVAYCLLVRKLQYSHNSATFTFGFLFGELGITAAFAHAVLAYPTGRLRTRFERWFIGASYVVVIGFSFALLAVWDHTTTCIWSKSYCAAPMPKSLLALSPSKEAFDAIHAVYRIGVYGVLAVVFIALILRRVHQASPAGKRVLVPLMLAAVLAASRAVLEAILGYVEHSPGVAEAAYLWQVFGQIAVPIALVVGLLRAELARGSVADLVVELSHVAPGEVRDSLARALHDDSLQVAYWLPMRRSYVDEAGRPVELPDDGRSVTKLDDIAAIVHDPELDPSLVEAAGAAARLALHNARLQADVSAQLAKVQESRRRIVTAGDEQRRKIERDLHDGAQQRLVALALELRIAQRQFGQEIPELERMLGAAVSELQVAVEELRELARGVHPAVLTEEGLAGALVSLAARTPVPVRIDAPDDRFPREIEAAAYFVACEAIQNAVKHSHATQIRVSAERGNGTLTIEVEDDGVGGARENGRGSGLRGLVDRVEAHGGTLRIESEPGQGTRDRGAAVRVVIADDSILLREGVARVLSDAGMEVVASVGEADALRRAVATEKPDVAIIDVRMPPTQTDEGARAAETIRERHPDVGVLMLSQIVEPRTALRLFGERPEGFGYLLKDRVLEIDDFVEAVKRVARGGTAIDPQIVSRLVGNRRQDDPIDELSPREREVLGLMAEGRSNSGICAKLFLSPKTVETHVSSIFTKLRLAQAPDDHRRVLAVLAYLRSEQ